MLICKLALLPCVSGVSASDGKSVLRDIRMVVLAQKTRVKWK